MSASQVEQYVTPEDIPEKLRNLSRGSAITHNRVEVVCDGYVNDLEWGVFDLLHRPYVHHTYDNFIPLISSKDISILVTPWQGLPIYFQVMTAKLEPGVFYQSFNILGIVYCHQISRMVAEGEQTRVTMDWYFVSHWLFKWMHPLLNWRLAKLQKVQNGEDNPVRQQRSEMRKKGFRFTTDAPNFINANDLTDHMIVPSYQWPIRSSLANLPEGSIERLKIGPLEFLISKREENIFIWPGQCPHEGARLDAAHLCKDQLSCPWHGRKFRPVALEKSGKGRFKFLNIIVERDGNDLVIHETKTEPSPPIS